MLIQILLTTVLMPLVMGIVIALFGRAGASRGAVPTVFLLPVAAALASLAIEGMPPFPPIAAKQKLPYVLIGGGIVAAVIAIVLKPALNRLGAAIVGIVSLAIPTWWLGRNVIAANPTKATTLAIVLVIFAIVMVGVADRKGRRPASAPLPATLLATAIGTAIASVTGGYIGMAQMNGALAAIFGGWLLVCYIAYLRGNDDAFALNGMAALTFVWTAAIGVAMTVLFTPNATPASLVLAALPGAVFVILCRTGFTYAALPRAVQPMIFGLLAGIPAIVSILVAFL